MSTGRNFDEILRLVDSLQLTASEQVATPANWNQGEDVIILPAVSDEDAAKKYTVMAFYSILKISAIHPTHLLLCEMALLILLMVFEAPHTAIYHHILPYTTKYYHTPPYTIHHHIPKYTT